MKKIMNKFKKIAIVTGVVSSIGFSTGPTFADSTSYYECAGNSGDWVGCIIMDIINQLVRPIKH